MIIPFIQIIAFVFCGLFSASANGALAFHPSDCESITNPDWLKTFMVREAWLPFDRHMGASYLSEIHSTGSRGFGENDPIVGRWQFKFISHGQEPAKVIFHSDQKIPKAKERFFLTVLDWFASKPPVFRNSGSGVWLQFTESTVGSHYLVLDGSKINQLEAIPEYRQICLLPETQMKLVQNAYSKKFGNEVTESLIQISRSMKERSIYIAKVEEPYWIFNKNGVHVISTQITLTRVAFRFIKTASEFLRRYFDLLA